MGNNTTKARVAKCRARAITSKHVVRATFVSSFAMSHGTANGDFISNASKVFEMFAEVNAFEFGFDWGDVATVFDWSQRLRIESILMGHATWKIDMDNGFSFAFSGGFATNGINRMGLLHFEVFGQSEAKAANHTDLEKRSAILFFKMSGVCKPSSRLMSHCFLSGSKRFKKGG